MSELMNETTEGAAAAAAKAPGNGKKKATLAHGRRVSRSPGRSRPSQPASQTKGASKAAPKAKAAKVPKAKGAREGSKTELILGLLKRSGGVTLKELEKSTGWQSHSVRGFLSAVVNKKMGLTVASTKADNGDRTYSVKA